jgi:putative tryptophan/tyrosine transport system substrate-binding protein
MTRLRIDTAPQAWFGHRLSIAALLVLALAWARPALSSVEIVAGDNTSAHSEVRAELVAGLAGIELLVTSTGSPPAAKRASPPTVVVVLGSESLRATLRVREEAPIVAVLVPRDSFERAREEARLAGQRRPVSGVYLDQPWARQIALIRIIAPERRRIGVLSTPGFAPQIAALARTATEQRVTVVHELVESPQALHVNLMRIIGAADVVLAIPDTQIFSASTIQHILLTTFRARQPLIGFSPAYVQAGALAAVYSTPTQMAREAAVMVRQLHAGQTPPGGQYPRAFTVSVNRSVARSLDMTFDNDAALTKQLEQLERER